MRDVQVFLELEKVIPLTVKENEHPELEARVIIEEGIKRDKKNNTFLSSFELYESKFEKIDAEKKMFTFVKKAIDSFDPYFVHPDSLDEYDGESRRIAEKITKQMSIDDISEMMKEEFNRSFSATFTREDFSSSAEAVYNLLQDSMDMDKANSKKMDVYTKLTLGKVIPVELLEHEDGWLKTIEGLSSKIATEKEKESFLSAFHIALDHIHQVNGDALTKQ